jgi:uncharacterized protein
MKLTDIDASLKNLGFIENSIVETILVTKNIDGSFNAAPMGVIYSDNKLEVRTYTSSKTYENLLRNECVSLNISDNPLLFLKTAFKNVFEVPDITDGGIENSDAVIYAMKIREDNPFDNRASFSFKPTDIVVKREVPTVFSRGRAAAIEAIIHATRVEVFHFGGKEHRVNELLVKIDLCFDIISKTSDVSSTEMRVLDELKTLFKKWGVEL